MTNLVDIRKQIKKRKPTYKRVQTNQFPKLRNDLKWRRPKGMGNKDRKNRKGHVGTLKIGYGSPKALRGTTRDGFVEVVVENKKQLNTIDTKTQVAVIGKTVGGRKKLEILEEAKSNSIAIKNVEDISKTIEHLKEKSKSDKSKKKNTHSSEKGESDKSKEKSTPPSEKGESDKSKENSKSSPNSKPQTQSQSSAKGESGKSDEKRDSTHQSESQSPVKGDSDKSKEKGESNPQSESQSSAKGDSKHSSESQSQVRGGER